MKRTPELLQSPMFFGGSFPCLPSDPAIVNQKLWSNATWADGVREVPAASMTPRAVFRRDLLWTDARDVWHCAVASVWAEFSLPPPHHHRAAAGRHPAGAVGVGAARGEAAAAVW